MKCIQKLNFSGDYLSMHTFGMCFTPYTIYTLCTLFFFFFFFFFLLLLNQKIIIIIIIIITSISMVLKRGKTETLKK